MTDLEDVLGPLEQVIVNHTAIEQGTGLSATSETHQHLLEELRSAYQHLLEAKRLRNAWGQEVAAFVRERDERENPPHCGYCGFGPLSPDHPVCPKCGPLEDDA